MKKILSFSLLLLALTLITAGCGSDNKDVSIDILSTKDKVDPDGKIVIQTSETVLLQVKAKNTGIIMPEPKDIPGSFRVIGNTNIQYTAPQEPPDGDAVVRITVVAAADKNKSAYVDLKVLHQLPAGSVDPGNVTLFHKGKGADDRQFIATFNNVMASTGWTRKTPKYRMIPDKRWVFYDTEDHGLGSVQLEKGKFYYDTKDHNLGGGLGEYKIGHFADPYKVEVDYSVTPPSVKVTSISVEECENKPTECYSYSGVFIHSKELSGFGYIEATLELDPAIYGYANNDGTTRRQARATARVRVRQPSDRFQWITLLTAVGYGDTLNIAPTLARPFFVDGLSSGENKVDPDGKYVVYQSCETGTTNCAQRLLNKEKGTREGSILTTVANNTFKNPNLTLPIPIRAHVGSGNADHRDPYTDAALNSMIGTKKALPLGLLNSIPSQQDTSFGQYGASHPSLTSIIVDKDENGDPVPDGNSIGVFELSLNQWPPIARIMMARWPNNIPDDEPKWPGLDCTYTQINNGQCEDSEEVAKNRRVEMVDVLSRYSIAPFSFQPPMMAKIVQSPKVPDDLAAQALAYGCIADPTDPQEIKYIQEQMDPVSGNPIEFLKDSPAECKAYYEAVYNSDGTYALGYYDGNRMSVRQVLISYDAEAGKVKMKLYAKAITWDPRKRDVRDRTTRNYITDLVYQRYKDFIAVGVNGELDAPTAFLGVTAWRYVSGLAMVRRENKDYVRQMDIWNGIETDEDGNKLPPDDDKREHVKWEKAYAEWEESYYDDAKTVLNKDAYENWYYWPDSENWPGSTDGKKPEKCPCVMPPVEPELPETVVTDYEELDEMLGLGRFRIMYAIRDPADDCLIIAGYGLDVETNAMTGFMAKSYNKAFEQIKIE